LISFDGVEYRLYIIGLYSNDKAVGISTRIVNI